MRYGQTCVSACNWANTSVRSYAVSVGAQRAAPHMHQNKEMDAAFHPIPVRAKDDSYTPLLEIG